MTDEQLLIVAGAFAGGLVNGLTGFGTGMTALVLWLHALPVTVAATLVLVCSVAAQLQSLPSIWHALDIERLTPFLIGGLAGIPLGTWLLVQVSVGTVKFWVGLVVTIYCSVMLLGSYRPTVQLGRARRRRHHRPGRRHSRRPRRPFRSLDDDLGEPARLE